MCEPWRTSGSAGRVPRAGSSRHVVGTADAGDVGHDPRCRPLERASLCITAHPYGTQPALSLGVSLAAASLGSCDRPVGAELLCPAQAWRRRRAGHQHVVPAAVRLPRVLHALWLRHGERPLPSQPCPAPACMRAGQHPAPTAVPLLCFQGPAACPHLACSPRSAQARPARPLTPAAPARQRG